MNRIWLGLAGCWLALCCQAATLPERLKVSLPEHGVTIEPDLAIFNPSQGDAPLLLDQLYDPETSIRFGCWYLNFLQGRFDGDVMEMVAAYNAGHGSVEDWLADPRFSADGETLLSIPFEQTARYYEKVMTAYEKYTTLYPDLFGESAAPSAEP